MKKPLESKQAEMRARWERKIRNLENDRWVRECWFKPKGWSWFKAAHATLERRRYWESKPITSAEYRSILEAIAKKELENEKKEAA